MGNGDDSNYAFADPNQAQAFAQANDQDYQASRQQYREMTGAFDQQRGLRDYLERFAKGQKRPTAADSNL